MKNELSTDVKALIEALSKMDCGDSLCKFAQTKTGMRTNGGCMCLSGLPRKVKRELERFYYIHKGEVIAK